jgi:hypothetical protein
MKCVCGTDMRLLQHNIHLCSSCGRARWGETNIPFGVIILIAVVTVVLLIVLGIVGNEGAQFRG